jgi:outer membrane protein
MKRSSVQQKGFMVMRVFVVALALSVSLAAGPTFAQAPAPGAAAPAQQPPAAPAPPAPKPVPPAAAQPAPAPPQTKFADGLKYAYVVVQRVAQESAEGKAAAGKIEALRNEKVKELDGKNKALQSAQQKLEQGGSVMSDQARAQLQADIERQQRDIQRFTEDAQQEITNATQAAQDEFQRKLNPVIERVAKEKQVDFVFSAAESGLIWANPGMDMTAEIIKAFDSGGAAAPAAKPAPPAATQKP